MLQCTGGYTRRHRTKLKPLAGCASSNLYHDMFAVSDIGEAVREDGVDTVTTVSEWGRMFSKPALLS